MGDFHFKFEREFCFDFLSSPPWQQLLFLVPESQDWDSLFVDKVSKFEEACLRSGISEESKISLVRDPSHYSKLRGESFFCSCSGGDVLRGLCVRVTSFFNAKIVLRETTNFNCNDVLFQVFLMMFAIGYTC